MTVPAKLRAVVWFGAGALLLALAISIAALALSIHNTSVNSRHARHLGLRSDVSGRVSHKGFAQLSNGDGELVWTARGSGVKESGQTPRWDSQKKQWIADHGTLEELRDVELGSKGRPLADGDLLRWERGRVVNSRDPMLTQELSHHVDTKIVRPATGDVLLYNETAGQWRNVPLRAFLTISGLGDVDIPSALLHGLGAGHGKRGGANKMGGDGLQDGARLEYDANRGHWSYRAPHARAWLSFCVPIDNSATGPVDTANWGKLDAPLHAGTWVAINPKSDGMSVFAVDQYSHGGMRISRKQSNIMTPRGPTGGGRPSASKTPYRIRATVSTVGFPPGAWEFIVSGESVPRDEGFMVSGSEGQMESFSLETVRRIGYEQTISLAYNARRSDRNQGESTQPLVQCMRISVEEL